VRGLRAAGDQRDFGRIAERDVTALDPRIRREAARAYARIASDETRGPLIRLLSDEDNEVVAFAAYGLGYSCAGHDTETVAALVARSPSITKPGEVSQVDASLAVARALGRCGGDDAEATLAAWLKGPHAREAALGLGDVAVAHKLKDETVVALTVAAAGSSAQQSIGEALAPFTRRDPPASAVVRVREVAISRLGVVDPSRVLAIRALGRTDAAAVPELSRVLTATGAEGPAERAEAARSLARLGDRGAHALAEALPQLVPGHDRVSITALAGDNYGVLSAALDALKAPIDASAHGVLSDLATLKPPDADAPPTLSRRVAHLRCTAARLLSDGAIDTPEMLGCDPSHGIEGELARLGALAQKPITGPKRLEALRALVKSPSAKVRAAAIEAMANHREIDEAPALLALSLASDTGGTVAAACEAITKTPTLATDHADVMTALTAAVKKTRAADEVETRMALLAAVGATKATALLPEVKSACASPSVSLRGAATKALDLLGSPSPCPATPYTAPAEELSHVVSRTKLVFDTEAGELTIFADPTLAPVAATRLVDLARAGFYDGMAVHRVVPGFVVQFGDKAGDGAGGCGREALRCETSPAPFDAYTVGVALAGRDTGSSQFFVTLSRVPHLDGDYTILGSAAGDWAAVAEGDVIRKVTVVE
jgi:cyclophilin family peptidyl-prolyl cis-trans isomerase